MPPVEGGLAEADRRLLVAIQEDLPRVSRPFAELARRCGLEEEAALERLARWSGEGLLREVSAILEPGRLGYRTTLVAVRAPAGRVEAIAGRVSAHPGVSHNYLREDPWNLWFTLAMDGEASLEAEVERLLEGEETAPSAAKVPRMVLPALRTFKIGVRLRPGEGAPAGRGAPATTARTLSGSSADGTAPAPKTVPPAGATPISSADRTAPEAGPPLPLSESDRALLRVLQQPLRLVSLFWAEPARRLGIPEWELLARLERLTADGAVRRVAGVLRHRQAGFTANGMACFRLPEAAIEAAGALAAGFAEVSHCYRRETRPDWPYGLYAMIHARTRGECAAVAAGIARLSECRDVRILYSVREFKKQRIRY